MYLRATAKISIVLCDFFPIYLALCFFLFGHTQVALSQRLEMLLLLFLFWLGTLVSLANFNVKKIYFPKNDENRC